MAQRGQLPLCSVGKGSDYGGLGSSSHILLASSGRLPSSKKLGGRLEKLLACRILISMTTSYKKSLQSTFHDCRECGKRHQAQIWYFRTLPDGRTEYLCARQLRHSDLLAGWQQESTPEAP